MNKKLIMKEFELKESNNYYSNTTKKIDNIIKYLIQVIVFNRHII